MNPDVTNELIFLAKLLPAPLTLELPDIVVENFDVPLKLEKRSPGFPRADLAGIANFVQMSLLNMHRHLPASLEFVAADIAVPIVVGR